MRCVCIAVLSLTLVSPLVGQTFTEAERLEGYALRSDTTVFVFDPQIYELEPDRVVVTGIFRGWDPNMEDRAWQLSQTNGVWSLVVPNTDQRTIAAGSQFKFRINGGDWVDPPPQAPNRKGGNLVFMAGQAPPSIRAEIEKPTTIWATFVGADPPLDKSAYRLTDALGSTIEIAAVLPNNASTVLVVPAQSLDITRSYFLDLPGTDFRSHCSFDGWFRSLYSAKELGANVSEDGSSTTFRVFAPRATDVKLHLYEGRSDPRPPRVVDLRKDADGVWEEELDGDLHGAYYDYTVHGPTEPGNHFYESDPVHISDPYTRVSDDTFGRNRVWRRTHPATPLAGGIPPMEDVVAYEMHVQDFTDMLPVDENLKGTIPAVTLPGLKNSHGVAIGFDHLVDLGINVIHLMPVQEYLHYPNDVWREAFADDPFMQEMGIAVENYQWGYRTTHAFAVESRYRGRGGEPGEEREQFRDLVQAFHDKGIAVIIDVVFNHTAEDMEGNHFLLHFNALDMHYYYRLGFSEEGEPLHIGDYGNEVKSEERPMVQRWIIDQCRHFIEEFGVDGFRIDLAGQTDQQTLKALRDAIGEDKIVYGEPWIGSNDPRYESNEDWDWYKVDAPITFFQDDARNAFQGQPSNPVDKRTSRGWAGGNRELRRWVKLALTNGFPDEHDPNRGINYLDIHDNWALADRFATVDWDGRQGVDAGPYRVAATLLLTSLGPLVLHGGTEMLRSKGLAPLVEIVKEHRMGRTFIHGKRDTYNLRAPNHFIWENLGRDDSTPGRWLDYGAMAAYWRGLIHFRLGEAGRPFRVGLAPPAGYYRWIEPNDPGLLGYLIDGKILVLINTTSSNAVFEDVEVPEGTWRLIGNGREVDHEKGVPGQYGQLDPGTHDLAVPPESALIWIRVHR